MNATIEPRHRQRLQDLLLEQPHNSNMTPSNPTTQTSLVERAEDSGKPSGTRKPRQSNNEASSELANDDKR